MNRQKYDIYVATKDFFIIRDKEHRDRRSYFFQFSKNEKFKFIEVVFHEGVCNDCTVSMRRHKESKMKINNNDIAIPLNVFKEFFVPYNKEKAL